MGAHLAKNNNRSRRRARRRSVPMAEINVTPFVDVMLVLLVVFMVAAPLMTVGVPVDLPQTEATVLQADSEEPLTVTLTVEGQIMIQTTEVPRDEFLTRLRGIAEERTNDKVFLRADGAIPYEQVAQIMGSLSAAGFSDIGLVTDLGGALTDGD
ncbi:MAG: protein TolR, partial [Planktomarina sp.]